MDKPHSPFLNRYRICCIFVHVTSTWTWFNTHSLINIHNMCILVAHIPIRINITMSITTTIDGFKST
jgi:hypothetical protein